MFQKKKGGSRSSTPTAEIAKPEVKSEGWYYKCWYNCHWNILLHLLAQKLSGKTEKGCQFHYLKDTHSLALLKYLCFLPFLRLLCLYKCCTSVNLVAKFVTCQLLIVLIIHVWFNQVEHLIIRYYFKIFNWIITCLHWHLMKDVLGSTISTMT